MRRLPSAILLSLLLIQCEQDEVIKPNPNDQVNDQGYACTGDPPDSSVTLSGKLYVANEGDNTLSVIDLAENKVINTIALDISPVDIAAHPTDPIACVIGKDSKVISILDITVDEIIDTMELPALPLDLCFSSDSMAFVILEHDTWISGNEYIAGIVIRDRVLVDSLYFNTTPPCYLHRLVCSSDSLLIGLAEIPQAGDASPPYGPHIINIKTGETLRHNRITSTYAILSADETLALIAQKNGAFSLIIYDLMNLETIESIYFSSFELGHLALSSNGHCAFLVNKGENRIFVFNMGSYVIDDEIEVSSPVEDIVLLEDRYLYASHPDENKVSVIDVWSKETVQEIPVGARPTDMTIHPRGTSSNR